jgi:iron complex outermembrane receptor protein
MRRFRFVKSAALAGLCAVSLITAAVAQNFNISGGDLKTALDAYMKQAGVELMYPDDEVKGVRTNGAHGALSSDDALFRILSGTGFSVRHDSSGAIAIVRGNHRVENAAQEKIATALAPTASGAALETVTVTSSKIGGDVQNIPISITALSQEQLTATQTAGGPDLIKQVPNMTFTKTNFSGYSIQLRGIGTQAISVTTDPAVAVAFNDIPFIRNHFFEQEFYDVSQVQVLRGPQGTLYGRNATAGVVNLTSAKPTDQFEAMASADIGNYGNRRLEGMINVPIVDDRLDLRIAGEWTKRQGYSLNEITDARIDGRDLWSGRLSVGWKPFENLQTNLVWEHFSEDDDRMRTAKQLCKTAPTPTEVGGVPVMEIQTIGPYEPIHYLSQGCEMTSLYSPDAFEVPNGTSLPYYDPLGTVAPLQSGFGGDFDPYASTVQSRNLRAIQTTLNPVYRVKNDTLEFNADYNVSPALTFSSQTGYNHDFLWSTEDYNRFDTTPGAFVYSNSLQSGQCPGPTQSGFNGADINCFDQVIPDPAAGKNGVPSNSGIFCDPQLGCSDRLVAEDLSDERAWQLSQEFRVASHFGGPLNFSVGANYLHYETVENYYVFINSLTLATAGWGPVQSLWVPGVSDNAGCLTGGFQDSNPGTGNQLGTEGESACQYIDPNPLSSLNNQGHNYFLSQNPYVLNSYALFGELYYNIEPDLKLTLGARGTEDRKHFLDIPSELLVAGYGYPITGAVDQKWDAPTGRAVLDWTPNLDFTDQTLVYGSYAHGYKAGGANPPGAQLLRFGGSDGGDISTPIHPLTFKPEYIDAFELGAKNTALDTSLTLNGDIFYYKYTGYQISEIVDRTAINNNYDATVKGAELEANWEPAPGLKFGFTGGWEDATANKGDAGIDLMDRTANNPDWILVKPFPTQASNCILPVYVVATLLEVAYDNPTEFSPANGGIEGACGQAYNNHFDPLTGLPYVPNPTMQGGEFNFPIPAGYPGFNPAAAPNNGEGFNKNLGGNQLPNAPHFTTSFTAEYSLPVSKDWIATLHSDFYWQSQSWARVFNDQPYDELRGYSNVNIALILTSGSGWQVMGYLKNVFDTTAITGDFLNSDDSGLTTNVFLTDPRLLGVRVTKNW